MDIKKSVFERLFIKDINLSSHKIELGALDDIRTKLDQAGSLMDIQNEIISAENKLKKALPIYELVKKSSEEAIKTLNSLGVDSGLIASFNNANKEASNGIKSIQTLISYLSKAI